MPTGSLSLFGLQQGTLNPAYHSEFAEVGFLKEARDSTMHKFPTVTSFGAEGLDNIDLDVFAESDAMQNQAYLDGAFRETDVDTAGAIPVPAVQETAFADPIVILEARKTSTDLPSQYAIPPNFRDSLVPASSENAHNRQSHSQFPDSDGYAKPPRYASDGDLSGESESAIDRNAIPDSRNYLQPPKYVSEKDPEVVRSTAPHSRDYMKPPKFVAETEDSEQSSPEAPKKVILRVEAIDYMDPPRFVPDENEDQVAEKKEFKNEEISKDAEGEEEEIKEEEEELLDLNDLNEVGEDEEEEERGLGEN